MKTDRRSAVERMPEFMGVRLSAAELDAVLEKSSFEYMKPMSHKFDALGSPWMRARGTMVRRGRKGASEELLSPSDQRRIDAYWRGELQRIGCDFPYDDVYGRGASAIADGTETVRRKRSF